MEIQSIPSFKGNPVRIGELVQKRVQELRYIRALANSLGQTDKDYIILKTTTSDPKNLVNNQAQSFAEGLKNFLTKGTMF